MRRLTFVRTLILAVLAVAGVTAPARAQSGTVMPVPKFTGLDNSGNPINGGKLCAYRAGTTTPQDTFTDSTLGTPNSNPVILDSAGRATVFLTPGASYKFLLKTAGTDTTCTTGSTLWTQDNVLGVPASSASVDVLGTVGETITAGQVVYLSDGSGAKTAGQWYKTDSANTYSSTDNWVGIAPSAISSGIAGTIRVAGSVSGLSSLTSGTKYYVASTAGVLSSTVPTNKRLIGEADTTTSIIIGANPPPSVLTPGGAGLTLTAAAAGYTIAAYTPYVVMGRLSLTSGVPVTTSDVTAATTLYWTVGGSTTGLIALYDGSTTWNLRTFTELSIAVPATTSTVYDVWVYDNSGAPALEVTAWTNDTTRATALVTQNGVLVKTGATTRRYVASFRTTTVSGQTEDSDAKRYVWNYYNRVPRRLKRFETTTSWTYNSSTIHQGNASASNQVEFLVGVAEEPVDCVLSVVTRTTSSRAGIGIGLDSTSTIDTTNSFGAVTDFSPGTGDADLTSSQLVARWTAVPAVGRHVLSWNEYSLGSTSTFYAANGTGNASGTYQSGLLGWVRG